MKNAKSRSAAALLALLLAFGAAETVGIGVAVADQPAVTLRPESVGPVISATILGANATASFDANIAGQAAAYRSAGLRAARWPGGSVADQYDWQTNRACSGQSYIWYSAEFDNFMNRIAVPAGLDLEITVNYGSANQPMCNTPGDPAAAAAWVRHANKERSYAVKWWEVGNEVYGKWETDKHPAAHDATTYAAAFADYARLMKAQDSSINVGVPVSPGAVDGAGRDWDDYVLHHTTFDYVDYHYYGQEPGKEDDAYLLESAPQQFAKLLATIRSEVAGAGKPHAPIEIGEIGSVYDNPGKQSASITQGLYAAEIVGEMMNAGVARAEWWNGNGGCGMKGNMSASLYGWQDFGGYAIFSEGIPTPSYWGCKDAKETIPFGTLLPTARAFQVLSQSGLVTGGQHSIEVAVPDRYASVRAYASTTPAGYGLLLVNRSATNSVTLPITIDSVPRGSKYTTLTYGKAQYDLSREGKWVGPVLTQNGAWKEPIAATLPPYSMTAVMISR